MPMILSSSFIPQGEGLVEDLKIVGVSMRANKLNPCKTEAFFIQRPVM